MQKRLFALMFALVITAAIYASPLYAQVSQSIGVTIPFAFSANGKALPAGTYRIEPVSTNRDLWGIRSLDDTSRGFLLAMSRTGSSDGETVVIFHRYGNANFLAGFKTSSYEVALPASAAEKTLRRSDSLSRMEVIEVDTTGSAPADGR